MKVKCSYCGSYISDTEEKCPNCKAPNENLKRVGNEVPTTIEELKKWYEDHNLPPEETTRFFIGKDIKEARAFGIYQDEKTKNFVVYKNKDTGARAVRYEGKDEAYAVNELYLKLKEEILHQKTMNDARRTMNTSEAFKKNQKSTLRIVIIFIVFCLCMNLFPVVLFSAYSLSNYKKGYYNSNDTIYYLYDRCSKFNQEKCEWYRYDSKKDDWSLVLNNKTVNPEDVLEL